jgi:hypothetical protein
MTPILRKLILSFKSKNEEVLDKKDLIILELQKLFSKLLLTEYDSIDTNDLTNSFGWKDRYSH